MGTGTIPLRVQVQVGVLVPTGVPVPLPKLIQLHCSRDVYTRSLVVDGNFKVDHVQQKNRADDVFVTDGELYMMAKGSYEEYLDEATKLEPRYSQVCV